MVAFFTMVDDHYVATEMAVSPWSSTQLTGTAVCGLLARELETHCPGDEFIPARFTVDLFRPVLNEPIQLYSEVVRDGRRVRVIDAAIIQRDHVRARATVMYVAVGEQPPGEVWQAPRYLPVPTDKLTAVDGEPPLFKSGNLDWTGDFASGQNSERKSAWHNLPSLVEGDPISPFQRAAFVGDATNLVCNWGTEGVGYINSDLTVTLARLPEGNELGLLAQDQVATAGIAIATATIYDRTGPLGTCVVTAISNARRQVDLAAFAEAQDFSVPSFP